MHRRQIRGTPAKKTLEDANSRWPFGLAAARWITEGTGRSVVLEHAVVFEVGFEIQLGQVIVPAGLQMALAARLWGVGGFCMAPGTTDPLAPPNPTVGAASGGE